MDGHVHPDMRVMYHHAKIAAAASYDPSKMAAAAAAHAYDPSKMTSSPHHAYDPNMMCMSMRSGRGDASSLLHHLPNMSGYPYNSYDQLQAMAAASHQQETSSSREDKWSLVQ